MARGLLGGMIVGGVVGAAGLALLSQSLPMPDRPSVGPADAVVPTEAPAAAPEPQPMPPEPAASETAAPATPVEPPTAPEAAASVEPATAPEAAAPAADQAPPPAPAEPETPASAEPASAEPAPAEPAPAAAAAPAPTAEAPAPEPAATAAAPSLPAEDGAVPPTGTAALPSVEAAPPAEPAAQATASDDAAEPAPAEPAPAEAAAEPATEAAPAAEAEPAEALPEAPPPALATAAPDLPAADAATADPGGLPVPDLPLPGLTGGVAELPAGTSASEAVPETADAPPPPPLTPAEEALLQPAPVPAAEPAPALIVPDEPPVTGQGSLPADSAGTPAVAGVETGRLPQIGNEPAAPVAEAAPDTRPLTLFARPFTREEGKPLFSILLVDPGGPAVDRATLAALPFPVTFVIDPMAPDAATAAALYRAAGQEVVMAATGIPAGATAADLEQTFQAHAAALPEAVAVIDLPEGGMGEDRPLATLAVPVIEAQGRGLITYDVGLNAGDQVARRADMPAATVFRRLDAEDESKPVIRRYLDRAAFKAAQDGQVMVIGTTRPETVAAILEWTVEGRATTVSLAPASAVLLAQ